MNQYLLLRDNKQTGPYTVEELAAKGLKAYDLVWLEGKSAAWRYPSEIAELKPFAPIVEEQPYDRFYKKAQQESHPALEQAQKAAIAEAKKERAAAFKPVEEPTPVQHHAIEETEFTAQEETPSYQEPEPQPAIHPKKIYVTLPASAGNGSRKEIKKPAASFSQSINTIAEERPVVKKQEVSPVVPINESMAYTATDKDLYTQLQENERSKKIKPRRSSMRPVMLGLTAACILLFGVIIGLYISNMKQQSQHQALEDMVKRIQDREKNSNNNVPVTAPDQPAKEMQQAIDSSNVQNNQPIVSDPKLHISTVARKGNTPPEGKQPAVTAVPEANQNNGPIVSNTSTQDEAGKEKITYQQAAIESARKNIHQQLLVENSNFKTGVLGGISNLHMTLSNNSRFPLDQVEIEIKYFGPEQKLVKTQILLFNDLAPGEQKTLEAPRTSRGITFDYAIRRIQSKVLGLAQHRF